MLPGHPTPRAGGCGELPGNPSLKRERPVASLDGDLEPPASRGIATRMAQNRPPQPPADEGRRILTVNETGT